MGGEICAALAGVPGAADGVSGLEAELARARGGAGDVIDEIGADAVLIQLRGISRSETEMLAEAVEVIDDGSVGDAGLGERHEIGESQGNAVLDFCIKGSGDARLLESG